MAGDEDRLARFQREALGTLSSLHAHDRAKKWAPSRAKKSVSASDLRKLTVEKNRCLLVIGAKARWPTPFRPGFSSW